MNRFARFVRGGLSASLVASAAVVIATSPAGATVKSGAINCTASIPALMTSVSVVQPSTTHVTGPYWVGQGAAFAITIVGGATNLPSSASGVGINSFQDVITKNVIAGTPTTTVSLVPILSGGFANDGFYYFDNDVADMVAPVKMDGLGGHPAAPTVVISTIVLPAPIPGTYVITTTLDPGAGILDIVDGPAGGGGAVFAPDITIGVTNSGTTDGPINYVGGSTSLTAKILGVIDAITSCAPSAEPAFTTHVQTDGTPAGTAQSPVVACDPTTLTGLNSAAKGLSTTLLANVPASYKEAMTFDGCIAPDQQAALWAPAKQGPLAADALTLERAQVSLKGKNSGNCTLVDLRTGDGQSANADSLGAYETFSTASIKWLNNLAKPVKGATTTGATLASRLVINTNGYSPLVTSEHNGVVTKGFGAGGTITIVSELDQLDPDVQDLLDCNADPVGPLPAAVFLQKTGLPLKNGPDVVLEIQIP